MESYASSILLVLAAVLSIAVVKLASAIYRDFTFWKKRGIPHLASAPVLGTGWKVLLRFESFPDYCVRIYRCDSKARYVGAMDLSTPILALRDPELIKEVAVKSFEHFTDHRGFIDEDMDPIFGKNLFSLRGERWKEMRNTLSPSFTASKMKFLFELVRECSNNFVGYLEDHAEFRKNLQLKDALTRYTTDVIATTAFGISVNSLEDRENEFFVRGTKMMSATGVRVVFTFLTMRLFPRLAKCLGLRFPPKSTADFFHRVIGETLKAREEQGIVRPDMIHMLMQAREKEREGDQELTTDDIVAQAFIFFLAGFETSSNAMCFMIHELAMNPDIQERLRKEVDRYFEEGNGDITYDALSKMEYTDMVISETLRKYPPVAIIDRVCVKSYTLPPNTPDSKEFTVEPNWNIWFPVYAIHHDPNYFPDPEKFDPERFSEENKGNILPYTYMPFGLGPRVCIGNRFALMETKIVVAHLLRKFVVKRSEKTRHPIVFNRPSFNLQAEGGFWVDLEKRKE